MAEDRSRDPGAVADPFDPVDPLSLDESLAIIGEETRARIVVELGEAVRDDGVTPATLSFSELMDRAGVADSGRFNYHLGELLDTFVKKTEAGYALRPPGHFLYRAIVAGTLTDRERLEPVRVGECPDCGADLAVEYPANHCLYVRCRDCGRFVHTAHFPQTGIDGREREEILDASLRTARHETGLLREGVCPACSARAERALRTDDPGVCGAVCDYDVYAQLSCSACNVAGFSHPASVALTAPPVVGFFDEHDRDPRAVRPWAGVLAEAQSRSTLVGEDPHTVEIPFELDDECLTVRLDADLQVVDADRLGVDADRQVGDADRRDVDADRQSVDAGR